MDRNDSEHDNRYQRHALIDWFDQDRVCATRVVVVGAGAIGNEVLKNLALLGVGWVTIIDFDKIETHNLTRTVLFRESEIGSYKSMVAAQACKRINPGMSVEFRVGDFWDVLTIEEIAAADAVLCCVDNFEARIRLNTLCLLAGTDLYNAGIDSRYAATEVFPYGSQADGACYECGLPPSAYDTMARRYSCGRLQKTAYEAKKIPTTAITASVAGSAMVALLLNRRNGHPAAPRQAIRQYADTMTLESTVMVLTRNPECRGCGGVQRGVPRIQADRRAGAGAFPCMAAYRGEIVLSEPVALRGTCTNCGKLIVINESVRRLNDNLMICQECQAVTMKIEYAERLTEEEFMQTFAAMPVPVKYLTYINPVPQFIIEFCP